MLGTSLLFTCASLLLPSATLRRRIEDQKASEVIVTAMFKLDNNITLQNTGCMALTNLSAEGKIISDTLFPSVEADCSESGVYMSC